MPCVLKFTGESTYVKKINMLLPPQGPEPAPKKRKLSVVLVDDAGSQDYSIDRDVWVRFGSLILTIEDRNVVREGKELNDKHIDLAQSLIKHQFTEINSY